LKSTAASGLLEVSFTGSNMNTLPKPKVMSDRMLLPVSFEPYEVPPGFGVITCYFNPNRYRSRLRNYCLFRESLRTSGMPCLTVECLFPGQSSELPDSDDVHTVIARDIMWQKERLLNLVIARIPDDWTTVAWLDSDILFENRNWAAEAVAQLDRHVVVQLFTEVIRLPKGAIWGPQGEEYWNSFAAIVKRTPNQLLNVDFALHGHTGFGWAAHRGFLTQFGLYDGCISGTGDHMMAHAFTGDWTGDCVNLTFGTNTPHLSHFSDWAQAVYRSVRAKVSYVPGTVFHLWHGDTINRRYVLRNRELAFFNFDPVTDLRVGGGGCWEWASDKPALHTWAAEYFAGRKEDGAEGAETPLVACGSERRSSYRHG
jgi:hypothetical protein